jgi:hypothetical protein
VGAERGRKRPAVFNAARFLASIRSYYFLADAAALEVEAGIAAAAFRVMAMWRTSVTANSVIYSFFPIPQ